MATRARPGLDQTEVKESALHLIGETPLVRLSRLEPGLTTPLVAKVEFVNPGGSVKDRAAVTMIDAAERSGALKPGGTLVEPTSGNTGLGLAMVAVLRGYRVIAVMPDKMSREKIDTLRAYGAEVVICPTDVAPESPQSYYRVADRLTEEIDDAFQLMSVARRPGGQDDRIPEGQLADGDAKRPRRGTHRRVPPPCIAPETRFSYALR